MTFYTNLRQKYKHVIRLEVTCLVHIMTCAFYLYIKRKKNMGVYVSLVFSRIEG